MLKNQVNKPNIAVSACLLGQPVRFDGGHKRSRFITDELSQLMDIVPVCPEMESGMGVPRPTIHLRRIDGKLRLTRSDDGDIDFTDQIVAVAKQRAEQLEGQVSGFIFQKKSPTCGMERVPVKSENGNHADSSGVGLFVQHFTQFCPLIPIEESGRLNDPELRENFIERIYALDRWNRLDAHDLQGFIHFHARHKLMLMARGTKSYTQLGRIVAGVRRADLSKRREAYIPLFMKTMAIRSSRKRHCNVLQHIMGYFKRDLTHGDKQELLDVMKAYRLMQTPLSTPMALFKHHLRKHPDRYLERQHYFAPYPGDLALRAHI